MANPRIKAAMIEQLNKLPLTSRAFRNDQLPFFAEALCLRSGYEKMLPMNSGAEAVETALKLARKWAYEVRGVAGDAEIIVCDGNFHGRTITIISFSPEEQYRNGFGPLTPGFKIIPYGMLRRSRCHHPQYRRFPFLSRFKAKAGSLSHPMVT
ncbi:hypothetical protein MASR2M15_29350 [Anaerolineales bacterium]